MSPRQKPGRSKQDYETPADFVVAVGRRFGPITYDLAASAGNAKALRFFDEAADSLAQNWTEALAEVGFGWLNPPFANLGAWAEKCALESRRMMPRALVTMLCPASVGTNWWEEHVDGCAAEVLFVRPRLAFVGCSDQYPKDLALVVYRGEIEGGTMYRPWKFK